MNKAYGEKFGFPLVIAVREHIKETLSDDAKSRLKRSKDTEVLISVVKAVKIANYRLQDKVEESLIKAWG